MSVEGRRVLRASFRRSMALLAVIAIGMDVAFFHAVPRAILGGLIALHIALLAIIVGVGTRFLDLVRAPDGSLYARFVSPNVLTIGRTIAIPPMALGVFYLDLPVVRIGVAVTFAVSALTDLLDGLLGRAFQRTSDFGRVIDPLADGLFYSLVGLALLAAGYLPVWYQTVVLLRYVPMLAAGLFLFLRHGPIGIHPTRIAKLSSFALAFATAVVIADVTVLPMIPAVVVESFLGTAAVVAGVSIGEYVVLGVRRLGAR